MPESYPSYVKLPTTCSPRIHVGTKYKSRTSLTGELKNRYTKNLLFLLMNPSAATKYRSDKTINKCAHIAKHDFGHLNIGSFSIVNVHPYYQSKSNLLGARLTTLKNSYSSYYYRKLVENLKVIHSHIKSADYVFLCTGEIPKNIEDKDEYNFLIDTIHSYIESTQGHAFLGKASAQKAYCMKGKYSYHLCPRGNSSTINEAKLHKIERGKFIDIGQNSIPLTKPLKT